MSPLPRPEIRLVDWLNPKTSISRRRFMASLATVSAAALLTRTMQPTRRDEFVEVNGWILKRSDLA